LPPAAGAKIEHAVSQNQLVPVTGTSWFLVPVACHTRRFTSASWYAPAILVPETGQCDICFILKLLQLYISKLPREHSLSSKPERGHCQDSHSTAIKG